MRPLTQFQDIHDRDAARLKVDLDLARVQGGTGEIASQHSTARRVVGSLRRAYREISAANAAVDRMNRPWVYQGRDVHGPRAGARRASH